MQKVQEGNNSFIPGLQQGLPCSLPSINTLRFPNFLKDLFFYFEDLWQLGQCPILGFHMMSPKFKLRNYRFFWVSTFMWY